jgi:DNA phosphorothioation-dependent restriction protein DptG
MGIKHKSRGQSIGRLVIVKAIIIENEEKKKIKRLIKNLRERGTKFGGN